jgi:hypothetical protein
MNSLTQCDGSTRREGGNLKGHWERRVGMLLRNKSQFTWAYSAPDTGLYGGQTRIDWIACDVVGCFWMIEVKQLTEGRKTFTIDKEVSAGQRIALTSVSESKFGTAILAIGIGKELYLYDWSVILWLPRITRDDALMRLTWTGEKMWQTHQLLELWERKTALVAATSAPVLLTAPAKLIAFRQSTRETPSP